VFGDSGRFIQQAEWLVAGEGYMGKQIWAVSSTGIRSETALPPGYPVFLAAVLCLTGPGDSFLLAARILQLLMSLGTCYLVYFAVRPRSNRLALLGFVLLATSFSSVGISRQIMSETLAVFLIGVLVWLVSSMETRGGNPLLAFSTGLLCVAVLLTAPATIVLSFCTWCYTLWRLRKQWRNLACLALGSLLIMVPWQVHCYRATGQFQPTVFRSTGIWQSGFTLWYRTWACKESDLFVFWRPQPFRELPDSVFSSKEQRDRLTALNERVADSAGFKLNHYSPDVDEAFREAAAERIAEAPWRFYLFLPLERAATLWFHCEVWDKSVQLLKRFSFTKRILESGTGVRAIITTMVGVLGVAAINAVPFALVAILLVGGVRSIRHPEAMPLLILFSVLAYTSLSAVSGIGELRRDFPFYPAILFILFYLGRNNCGIGSSEPTGSAALAL
jgi:4-amino-4-deoxy-L-arabinose transferase-like glycosyltransferase